LGGHVNNYARRQWRVHGRYERDQDHKSQNDAIGAASKQILRVIGSSPTDVQPVFEAIARSGVSVCGALACVVLVVDGSMIRVAATHGVRPERLERFRRGYPVHLSAKIDTAQTIRDRRMFHLAPNAGIQCHKVFTTSASTPMTAAAPKPYTIERAMCHGVLWFGSSAVRYGLPISVVGEHVGHGYC
jgi:hypothetical protein